LTDHRKEGEPNPNPWGIFAETQAALVSLVLTGGFSVRAGVEAPVFQEQGDNIHEQRSGQQEGNQKGTGQNPERKEGRKKDQKG
jgi:hypothetical protein